jgi:Protein of unknown function (DUF2652)
MDIENGYLFITDITGYTQFLTQSELDHAKGILDALFDSILEHLHPPMIISGTQGDAIICYFPENAFVQRQSIMEGMEEVYFDFQNRLGLMALNSTCTCRACANMSALDLKVFLHYGQYILQQIGERVDLQGADVILVHRLMKNSIKERFGLTGYGLITEPAARALGISGLTDGMHEHTEQVEHFGEVRIFVHDLGRAWEARRQRGRQVVTPEAAMVQAEALVPIPLWVAWDLSFRNDVRQSILGVDEHNRVGDAGARLEAGAKFHCVHSASEVDYMIVEMNPPHYVTTNNEFLAYGVKYLITLGFDPVEGRTRFSVLFGKPFAEVPDEMRAMFQPYAQHTAQRFAEIVAEEIAAGRIQPEQLEALAGKKGDYLRASVSAAGT